MDINTLKITIVEKIDIKSFYESRLDSQELKENTEILP